MSSEAAPARLDYNDFVLFTGTHPEGEFELLDGVIFKLAPDHDAHRRTRTAIAARLSDALDPLLFSIWSNVSFPAPGWFDGPRPDNFVARGRDFAGPKIRERPGAGEVVLVIEVSSSSRRKDLKKAAIYARLAIPEYWLVDLETAAVIVYAHPAAMNGIAQYRTVNLFRRGATVSSMSAGPLSIETAFLLRLAEA